MFLSKIQEDKYPYFLMPLFCLFSCFNYMLFTLFQCAVLVKFHWKNNELSASQYKYG